MRQWAGQCVNGLVFFGQRTMGSPSSVNASLARLLRRTRHWAQWIRVFSECINALAFLGHWPRVFGPGVNMGAPSSTRQRAYLPRSICSPSLVSGQLARLLQGVSWACVCGDDGMRNLNKHLESIFFTQQEKRQTQHKLYCLR